MRDKCVADAMISIDKVFMLDKHSKLDNNTMELVGSHEAFVSGGQIF